MPELMRVALIGAGYFGQFHIDAWQRAEGAELVAIVDRDAAKAASAGVPVFTDAAEMAASIRPDIIDIAAPPATHAQLVGPLAALCHNLICQKPFCRSLAEAEAILATAEANGARVIIHENFRNQPWYREAMRLVASGVIGSPYEMTFRLRPGDGQGRDAYMARQPYFQEMKRFLIHETGIHWIDVFRAFWGEPDGVYADLRRLNPVIQGEDAGLVILDWADGRRAILDGNRLSDHIAEDRRRTMGEMLIEGSAGTLRLDGDGHIWLRAHGDNEERAHQFDWHDRNFGGDCVYLSCIAYLDSFRTGTPHPTEAQSYLANMRIVEAIYESAESRRRIAFD
ncbi:MAG: Gfo/Idh/MocA family oxidoreductase [Pseudomonadota bacterium]